MERIRGERAAEELSQNIRAAVQSMFFRLDNERPRPFRKNEPVAT